MHLYPYYHRRTFTCLPNVPYTHQSMHIPKPMHTHPSTTYVCLTAYIVTFCTCNVPTVHTCPLAYFITKSYVRVLASLWGADTEGLPAIPGRLFKGSNSISCVGLAGIAVKGIPWFTVQGIKLWCCIVSGMIIKLEPEVGWIFQYLLPICLLLLYM